MKPKIPKAILKKMEDYPLFYQAVWKACAEIPKGKARSYGWIAKKIKKPGAARAVGQALAKNPFSPIIPCHRVVSAAGKLTGFSAPGGIKKKADLLKEEGWDGKI